MWSKYGNLRLSRPFPKGIARLLYMVERRVNLHLKSLYERGRENFWLLGKLFYLARFITKSVWFTENVTRVTTNFQVIEDILFNHGCSRLIGLQSGLHRCIIIINIRNVVRWSNDVLAC